MADPKKPDPAAAKAAVASPALAPAGESGDPAVHQLLAELETHRSNGNADGVQACVDRLAAFGFRAG